MWNRSHLHFIRPTAFRHPVNLWLLFTLCSVILCPSTFLRVKLEDIALHNGYNPATFQQFLYLIFHKIRCFFHMMGTFCSLPKLIVQKMQLTQCFSSPTDPIRLRKQKKSDYDCVERMSMTLFVQENKLVGFMSGNTSQTVISGQRLHVNYW